MAGIVMREEKVRQCKVFVVLMQGEDSCWEGSDAAVAPAKRRVCGGQGWGRRGLRWGQLFIAPLPLCFYLNGQTGGGEHRRPPTLLRKQTQQRASVAIWPSLARLIYKREMMSYRAPISTCLQLKVFSAGLHVALDFYFFLGGVGGGGEATQKAICSCSEKS